MKVLFIIDSLKPYGAELSLVNTVKLFQKVEPVFLHINKEDQLKSELISNGIKVYSLNSSKFKIQLEEILEIIKIEKPEIVHSTLFKSDLLSRNIKRVYPNFLLIGSLVSNSYSKNRYKIISPILRLKLFLTQFRDRRSITEVDFFISNSKAIVQPNIEALGITKKKIQVIHRGREIPEPPYIFPEDLKNKFSGKKIFVTVGRLSKSKGHLDLILAFNKLCQVRKDVILLIVGDGPMYGYLSTKIDELNLSNKVHLLGYRNDIKEILFYSDFFVFASYYEGLPGALIEAILMKKPCMASDIPENKECFPPESGLFFKLGDIESIYNKYLELLNEDWKEETECNFRNARNKFSIENSAAHYEKFYLDILNHHL